MTTPSQCQLSCTAAAVSNYCRGPPVAISTALAWDAQLARPQKTRTLFTHY